MKLTRKSYNRRALTFGTLIFLSIALISTGFASWVMSTNANDQIEDGSIQMGTITDGSLKFKDLAITGDSIIKFDPAKNDSEGEIKWDEVNSENLSVTIGGSITPNKYLKEIIIDMPQDGIPAGVKAAATAGFITLPDCAKNNTYGEGDSQRTIYGVMINSVTTIPGTTDKYLNVNEDDDTVTDFTYTISFGWGEKFNGQNPSVYLDNEINPDTGKKYTADEKLDILMEFRTTIYPSLAGKTKEEIFSTTFDNSEEMKFVVNVTAVAA